MSATKRLNGVDMVSDTSLNCYCLWYYNVACPNEVPLRVDTMASAGCAFHCVRYNKNEMWTPKDRVRYVTVKQGGVAVTITLEELWVIAQTVYGETNHFHEPEQVAVGWVIRNRLTRLLLLSHALLVPYIKICRELGAFTCWLDEAALQALRHDNVEFMQCLMVARNVLDDQYPDPTRGALYYAPTLREGLRIGQYMFSQVLADEDVSAEVEA